MQRIRLSSLRGAQHHNQPRPPRALRRSWWRVIMALGAKPCRLFVPGNSEAGVFTKRRVPMKTRSFSEISIVAILMLISSNAYSVSCSLQCGSCGLYSGDEMDDCHARQSACLSECMASQYSTPSGSSSYSGYSGVTPSYGGGIGNYFGGVQVPLQQGLGMYCCDAYGNRRCGGTQYLPIGSSCGCAGQGYGIVCP